MEKLLRQNLHGEAQSLARQTMTMTDIATLTPELEAICREFVARNHLKLVGPARPRLVEMPTATATANRRRTATGGAFASKG